MSLPQNMGPKPKPKVEPEAEEATKPAVVDSASTDKTPPAKTAEEIFAEDASDARLRAWAKENGMVGVPGKRGQLSSEWREKITSAMAAASDPKEEDSAKVTSSELSASAEEKKTSEKTSTGGDDDKPEEKKSDSPSERAPVTEYRSVFEAPNTFVTGQAFTA